MKQNSARKRAEMIMKVRCGLLTAKQAATQLGVSRKTYYKWEQRGLSALLKGVDDQKGGRPKKPEPESDLEKQLAHSRAEIESLRQKLKLKDIAAKMKTEPGSTRTKKK
ncbi:MAG TPA: helix-turn-helix domain-containing protein [Chromatiaceae bacterium]|nr:helix-turn-helix domain-containing protein [Chromatiaceae bacterium]